MTKCKICGLRRPEDVAAVNAVLPDYAGFVFAASKRQISPDTAAALKKNLDTRVQAVGVFVNQDIDFIETLVTEKIIDLVQLHGDEGEAFIEDVKARCGCPVIRAVGIGESMPPLLADADYLLFDTLSVQRGGTGLAFDWRILEGFRERPYFLAGGLDADNVAEAIAQLSPFCVDVSSGVETDGVKDAEKIKRFVDKTRRA